MRVDSLHGGATYVPSFPELMMVAAVYAMGLLFFCGFGCILGNLQEREQQADALQGATSEFAPGNATLTLSSWAEKSR
jgi:hypothetical protein